MKKFKLFTLLTLIVTSVMALSLTTACNSPEEKWDGRTYEITVTLADGETPAQDVRLALCFNKADNTSQCLNPVKTDANGKATIVIPEAIEFVGNPVLHFYKLSDLPAGSGVPSNLTTVAMADGSKYEHAIELSQKSTTLVLTVA